MLSYKLWSKEEAEYLREQCNLGKMSYKQIGEKLGRSSSSCQSYARLNNIKSEFISGRKYEVNHDFFEPNPTSAYWAGFAAADGNVTKHSLNCYGFRLEISNADVKHLEKLKEQSKFEGPIKHSLREGKYLHSRIYISSNKWKEDLEKYWNVIQNKTLRLAPPNITDEYLKFCYFIGYLDGDGCVWLGKKNDRLVIRFLSSSFDIIKWCQTLVMEKFPDTHLRGGYENHITFSSGKYPVFNMNGIRAAVLFDFLSKFDVPSLDRKWKDKRILDFVESQKQKHPHFFTTPLPTLNYPISSNIEYATQT